MTTAAVPSRTTANVAYTVTLLDDGAAVGSCPAGGHGRTCWNVNAVRQSAYDAVEAAWDAQVAGLCAALFAASRRIELLSEYARLAHIQAAHAAYGQALAAYAHAVGLVIRR